MLTSPVEEICMSLADHLRKIELESVALGLV